MYLCNYSSGVFFYYRFLVQSFLWYKVFKKMQICAQKLFSHQINCRYILFEFYLLNDSSPNSTTTFLLIASPLWVLQGSWVFLVLFAVVKQFADFIWSCFGDPYDNLNLLLTTIGDARIWDKIISNNCCFCLIPLQEYWQVVQHGGTFLQDKGCEGLQEVGPLHHGQLVLEPQFPSY